MKDAYSILLAVLLAVGLMGAQDKDKDKGKHEGMEKKEMAGGNDAIKSAVSGLDKSLRDATLKGDSSVAERVLAEDYHGFTAANMQPVDKNMTVNNLKSGKLKYSAIDVTSEDVQVYSPTLAVAHGEASVKGTLDGKSIDGKYHFGRVWTKRAGKWQAVWFQTTKIQ